MKLVKKSKRLVEGAGAGYDILGTLFFNEVNNLEIISVNESSDSYYGTEMLDVVCKFDAKAEVSNLRASSYYYGGEIKGVGDIDLKVDKCLISVDKDEWNIDFKNAKEVADYITSLEADFDMSYGGGWSHSTYDGTIAKEGYEIELDSNGDWQIVDAKILDKDLIECIDKIVTGKNVEYVVIQDGEEIEEFENKQDAIDFAEKNNCSRVEGYSLSYEFNGEYIDIYVDIYDNGGDYGDIVWKNDNIEQSIKEDTNKKTIKKSKRLVEGAGAGYNVEGSLINIKINSLEPKKLDDGTVSFTCDIDCDIEDTIASNYYNSAKISGEMACKIVSGIAYDYSFDYDYSFEDLDGVRLERALEDFLESELESLQFKSETIGGGWIHHKFDGNFSIESDYCDLNCEIVNKAGIELIDTITRDENYLFEVYDYDEVDGMTETFGPDEEDKAIEYAKKNNLKSVEKVYLNYTLLGNNWEIDPMFGYEELVWKNDNIEQSIKEDTNKKTIKKSKRLVEGAGAGYNVEGSLINIKINSLEPKKLDDGTVSFTCDIDCDIEDTIASNYYNSAKISGEMACKIVSGIAYDYSFDYDYSFEDLDGVRLERALEDFLESELESLQFKSETIGGGWIHHKFDGNFSIESDYCDLNCEIVNKAGIELIDTITRDENYEFDVYNEKDGMIAVFGPDEEDEAIEYAKKNNCTSVERVYLNYILDSDNWGSDPMYDGDGEVVWYNDDAE